MGTWTQVVVGAPAAAVIVTYTIIAAFTGEWIENARLWFTAAFPFFFSGWSYAHWQRTRKKPSLFRGFREPPE